MVDGRLHIEGKGGNMDSWWIMSYQGYVAFIVH